ncbi:hypothetical protein [Chloroflexus sp.]|uniref:hypothetical protein n=1 Tax=Chloroflexus sp. TaxID=1904827 RepID=UPI002ACD6978|nr:hypothetical protein [Chloroflexus sp.]
MQAPWGQCALQWIDDWLTNRLPAGESKLRRDYLAALESEMERLPKISALGREQRELSLEEVYVPLAVVETAQAAQFYRHVRYADDLLLFHNDKAVLHAWLADVRAVAATRFGLQNAR